LSPAKDILQIVASHRGPIDDDLAARLNLSPRGGHSNTGVRMLRSNDLIGTRVLSWARLFSNPAPLPSRFNRMGLCDWRGGSYSPDALARVQVKIDSADWGYDQRSGDWAGKAIAAALDLDLSDEVQKERCKGMLEAWIAAKALKCCQNQAQRPEAVTATRWLLATA
jgi:hypothetical protein